MRAGFPKGAAASLAVAMALGACNGITDAEKNAPLGKLNVIDASDLNELMLNFSDPEQAVDYFREASAANPERVDLRRGHAQALSRAGRFDEAVVIYTRLVDAGQATNDDRLDYADALIRTGNWKEAKAQLDAIPPTYETYDRYRLEAMVADSSKDWERADSFYEIARGLTTRPAPILNNWGISHMARGDFKRAEKLFLEAITYDDKLFNPKNNLVIARGRQGNYRLPVLRVNEAERAQLLYNLGLEAVRNGDIAVAKGLFEEAIDTHPQHFEAAAAALEQLQASVVR
ncbi:MAG: tetratricopeptide repeat protein [Paracoccaceae bacterium]